MNKTYVNLVIYLKKKFYNIDTKMFYLDYKLVGK